MLNLLKKILKTYRMNKGMKRAIKKLDCDTARIGACFHAAPLTNDKKGEIDSFWHQYIEYKVGYSFFELVNVLNKYDVHYIPDSIFYTMIVPKLNRYVYANAFSDKGVLNHFFYGVDTPLELTRNVNGNFFKKSTLLKSDEDAVKQVVDFGKPFIIKPSIDSSRGKNVSLVKEYDFATVKNLFKKYNKDFVVQECVSQHLETSRFNATSLNTFRVTTLLLNNRCSVLSSMFRYGLDGASVDNAGAGGVGVGVREDGFLHEYGFSKDGRIISRNHNGVVFKDVKFSFFQMLLDTAKSLHLQMPFCAIVGWDLAVDVNGRVVLIEVNMKSPGILFQQMCSGPIFGNRFEEVMRYIQ